MEGSTSTGRVGPGGNDDADGGGKKDPPILKTTPALLLHRAQWFAFIAFGLFVLCALAKAAPEVSTSGKVDTKKVVTAAEFDQIRLLCLFLIAALLPSDAILRFTRGWLYAKIDDPDKAAKASEAAPVTTNAQNLAFATYVGLVALAYFSSELRLTTQEYGQIVDSAQVLIIALLPSDVALRFGRAIYQRSTDAAALKSDDEKTVRAAAQAV